MDYRNHINRLHSISPSAPSANHLVPILPPSPAKSTLHPALTSPIKEMWMELVRMGVTFVGCWGIWLRMGLGQEPVHPPRKRPVRCCQFPLGKMLVWSHQLLPKERLVGSHHLWPEQRRLCSQTSLRILRSKVPHSPTGLLLSAAKVAVPLMTLRLKNRWESSRIGYASSWTAREC